MLGAAQITAALDTLNSRSPSAADITSLQTNAPKLWDNLFQSTVYRETSSLGSRDGLKNSLSSDKSKQTFFLALSDVLKIDEKKIQSTWDSHLKPRVQTDFPAGPFGLNDLITMRDMYSDQLSSAWSLLHELLRIDLDPGHPLHATVSSIVDKFMSRNLVSELLKHLLDTLREWQPAPIDRSVLTAFSAHEVSKYIQTAHLAWAVDFVEENCRCLDTLVLLSYSRQNLNLSDLTELLTKFVTQPLSARANTALQPLLEHAMRNDLTKIDEVLRKMDFRYVVLFSGCFQFWRLFQPSSEQGDHPLLAPVSPDYNQAANPSGGSSNRGVNNGTADSIFETLQSVTEVLHKAAVSYNALQGTIARNCNGFESLRSTSAIAPTNGSMNRTSATAFFLWKCFLQSFASRTIVGAEFVTTQDFQRFSELVDSFEIVEGLQTLVSEALSDSSLALLAGAESADAQLCMEAARLLPSDPNTFIYCSVLQELTNVLILTHTLRDESSLLDLGSVTSLVQATYRGQAELGGAFWAAWSDAQNGGTDHYYPLCRLVQVLLENTPHDPQYLWKILTALAGSAQSCMSILDILNQPVHVIGYESLSQLQFRSSITASSSAMFGSSFPNTASYDALQWDTASTWLREHDGAIPPGTLAMKVNADTVNLSNRGRGLWAANDTQGADSAKWYTDFSKRVGGRGGANMPRFVPNEEPSAAISTASSAAGLCTPSDRAQGTVLDADISAGRCLVRWDMQCLWWTLAFDALMKVASASAAAAEDAELVQVLLKLLTALLREHQQGVVVAFFLETKWNEVALLSLLRACKCEQLYPILSRNNVRITTLRADVAATYDLLVHQLGVSSATAEQIVAKVGSPSVQESALYELSFASILSKVATTSLASALRAGRDATQNQALVAALSLYATISNVSLEWEQALTAQTRSVFAQTRGGNGVYEALHAVTSVLPPSFPMLVQVNFLMSQHVIAQAGRKKAVTSATHLPLSALFAALDTRSSGSLATEELIHGLTTRGCEVGAGEFALLLQQGGLGEREALDIHDFYKLAAGVDLRQSDQEAEVSGESKVGSSALIVGGVPERLKQFRQRIAQVAQNLTEDSSDADGALKTAGIFLLNQFNQLFSASAPIGTPEESCFLLLRTVHAIDALLDTHSTVATFIVDSIAGNVAFLESLLQVSMALGKLTTRSNRSNSAARPATFKDLLAMAPTKSAVAVGSNSVLPLDFSVYSGTSDPVLPPVLAETLFRVSSVTMSIMSRLATAAFQHQRLAQNLFALATSQSPDGLTGLSWLTSLVPAATVKTAVAGGASNGSYMCLLAGMLHVSAVAPQAPCEQLKLTVTRLLIQLVELMPSDPGSSNIADCIGTDNLSAVAAVLSEHMQSTPEAVGSEPSLRSATLEFLLTVARIQPAALCLLIASRNASADTDSATSHGPIADAIVSVMTNAEQLYTEDPRALHILYQLLAVICKATEYHILVKTALFLIQSKKFWDHVTAPLMFDLPAAPKLDTEAGPFTAELFQPGPEPLLDVLDGCVRWSGSPTGRVQELTSEVNLHAHRLHCHAAALALLSIERYGMFYEIDVTVALTTTKKLQAFYVKATESHRFISWIKHYLLISVDGVATADLEERAHELGFDLHDLVTFTDLRPEARYGIDYKYETAKLTIALENHLRLAQSKNLEIDALDRVDIYLLSRFAADISRHNLSCVLSDAAMDLIRCWRQFLEFYVLPGSAAKQYQQKENARHSADTGSGPRGRKHSFDGDDIDGTSGSPVIGTLSPVTSAASNASPTASKKSAFSGDKRSYEVVAEVMTQLECHRADGCMNTVVGRFAVAEKCELLVSMIHHQLKVVAARTSDPSKSVIISRDLGSMRLTQDKMEKLLEKLDDLYRDLIFSATDSSEDLEGSLDDPQDLKNIVALRLLTSMMLLLNSIFAFNSADDAHSKLSLRRRSIYLYAVTALKNLTQSHGVAVFSNTSSLDISDLDNIHIDGAAEESKGLAAPSTVKDSSNRLSTEQAVAQVCLQIMKLAVPRSSGEPVISLTDIAAWRALLVESEAITLLTQTVQALATATSLMPQWDANYAGWKVHELEVGVKGSAECSFPTRLAQRTVKPSTYEETKCMLVSLLSALDAVLGGVSAKIITVQNTAPLNTLLQVVINAPVFRHYQQVILAQPDHVGAVLMGYNSSTTEVSLIAACWIRVINLVEAVIIRFPEASATQAVTVRSDGPVVVTQQDLSNTVCSFIRTYVDLLLLPMRPVTHRYSVQQLSLMRAALNLFTAANTKLPIWKVQLSALHPEVSNRVLALMRGFSLLLWHGEDMETMEQQRRLLAHCVAVSSTEKREERAVHPRKIRKRSGSLGGGIGRSASVGGVSSPEPQHVHFGETTVLGAGMSIMKTSSDDGSGASPGGGSIMKSKRTGLLRVTTGGESANDGILNTLVEFLLDIEAHMIAVMTPLATYIRHITPIPFEVSNYDEFGRPLFPLGNRVFYVSDRSEGSLVEGFVYKLHGSGDLFDVMLLDDMIETEVHTTQVRYTAAPIVQYQSLSDLAKHAVDDNTITIAYRHGHPEVSNSLSTAHLLRSLQLATSAVTGNRMQNQRMYPQAGQDLSVLAGQLAWLVVSNIAHHALAPMDREISMIHQLNDLKRAIRPRDHSSGLGSSSAASGSTSPFVSYLDHRDRLPMTPMAGTLTPTGSIGGSSGASTSAYLKWMHTAEWANYVTFLDKWCEEIFYMLGRGATLVTAEQEEVEESPNARIRKKRIGLRARIEWVQSPEEV